MSSIDNEAFIVMLGLTVFNRVLSLGFQDSSYCKYVLVKI